MSAVETLGFLAAAILAVLHHDQRAFDAALIAATGHAYNH